MNNCKLESSQIVLKKALYTLYIRAYRTTRRRTNSRSVKSWIGQLADYSQLAEMFDLKFAVNNPYKCD